MSAATTPDPLDQVTLSQTGGPHKHQVVSPPHEVAAGQFLDLHPVDVIESKVEGLQRARVAETGQLDATFNTPLPTSIGRRREELLQELKMGKLGLVGGRQDFIQLLRGQWDLQGLQVVLNLLA
jgi:hypothetical protein